MLWNIERTAVQYSRWICELRYHWRRGKQGLVQPYRVPARLGSQAAERDIVQ